MNKRFRGRKRQRECEWWRWSEVEKDKEEDSTGMRTGRDIEKSRAQSAEQDTKKEMREEVQR